MRLLLAFLLPLLCLGASNNLQDLEYRVYPRRTAEEAAGESSDVQVPPMLRKALPSRSKSV